MTADGYDIHGLFENDNHYGQWWSNPEERSNQTGQTGSAPSPGLKGSLAEAVNSL
jgi:hypothetical protein